MKSFFVFIFLVSFIQVRLVAQGSFRHPGLLVSEQSIDRISQQLEGGNNAHINKAWSAFKNNFMLTSTTNWVDQITINGIERYSSGGNWPHAERDFGQAYIKAIYYNLKKNSTNAAERDTAKAYAYFVVNKLMKYANKITYIGGDSNWALATAFNAWQCIGAAELLRNFEGWKESDQLRFRQWVYDVWVDASRNFMYAQNSTCDSHYPSNWTAGNIDGLIAAAVYLDDPFLYALAKFYVERSPMSCSLSENVFNTGLGYCPYRFCASDYGYFTSTGNICQNCESTRDQPHTLVALGQMQQIAESAWSQGDDFWSYQDYAIYEAIAYSAIWNSINATSDSTELKAFPSNTYFGCDGYQYVVSDNGRSASSNVWQMGINHFKNRLGMDMRYAEHCHDITCENNTQYGGVETGVGVGASQYCSGGMIGFGDLLFYEDQVTAIPTRLTTQMTIVEGSSKALKLTKTGNYTVAYKSGDVIKYSSLLNIAPGTTIILQPQITGQETDNGQWSWDDDSLIISRERTVTLGTKSAIYRAIYTNKAGAKSECMFCLHVDGTGFTGTLKPYYTISHVTTYSGKQTTDNGQQITELSVSKYGNATLGVECGSQTCFRSFKWERKLPTSTTWNSLSDQTDVTLELSNISTAYDYRLTCTNINGVENRFVFSVSLTECNPYIVTTDTTVQTSLLAAMKGTTVMLVGEPITTTARAQTVTRHYQWVICGDTVRDVSLTGTDLNDTLYIENITERQDASLVFTRTTTKGSSATSMINYQVPVYNTERLNNTYYYIKDRESGKYLSSTQGNFIDKNNDSDDDDLQWYIHYNTSIKRYVIQPKLKISYRLDNNGAISQTSDNSTATFDIFGLCGTDYTYALRTAPASGSTYMTINTSLYTPEGSTQTYLTQFPFEIINVTTATGITSVTIDNGQKTTRYGCSGSGVYNISGQRLASPQSGINIFRDQEGSVKKVFIK